MKRKQWILVCALAVVLAGAGYGVMAWINRPMGQALTLQTPTEGAPTLGNLPTTQPVAGADQKATVTAAIPLATPTTAATEIAKTCGNTGSMHLLVVGLTTPTKEEILGADAIRLVTIDFDQPAATILSLPAILWVETPALVKPDERQNPLTMVYTRAYLAAEGVPERARHQKATQALAQAIVDNFGYVPDHYITMDDRAFIKFVDALGGVEITLPKAVDGTAEEYGIYPAGRQLLDGRRALNFARLFHPNGMKHWDVWGNLERQNLMVKAILATVLKPQNWAKIPGLMNELQQAVTTDLSLTQTLDLACMAQKVGKNTRLLAVAEAMVKMDGQGRMIPDKAAIRGLVAELGGGE